MTPTSPTALTASRRGLFLAYAGLLSTIGLLASDMYLPALAMLKDYFRTDAGSVGLSLSLYMVGFAAAQLFYGAVSDQIGRKRPLFVGLSLFAAGTLGCLAARSVELFLVFRVVQAFGVGAAYVLWQPMIVDLFPEEQVRKLFARFMAAGSLSPALAPLAGGYLAEARGWRAIFWLLFAVSALLLLWTATGYRESLPLAMRRPFSPRTVLGQYASFFSGRFFMGYAGALASGIAAYFVYVTMVPFVLARIGYAPDVIGLMSLPIVAAFIVGTELGRRLHPRFGDYGSCRLGAVVGLGGALLLLLTTLKDVTSPWQLLPGAMLLTLGNGFLLPIGTACLIRRHADRAGACASVIGLLTALAASLSTFVASLLVDELGVRAMSGTALFFAVAMNGSLASVAPRRLEAGASAPQA